MNVSGVAGEILPGGLNGLKGISHPNGMHRGGVRSCQQEVKDGKGLGARSGEIPVK